MVITWDEIDTVIDFIFGDHCRENSKLPVNALVPIILNVLF